MRSWKARLALCFVLAALGAAVVAPQASAACAGGWVCLFNGPNWETEDRPFRDSGLQNLPAGLNDIISSVTNNTNRWAILYQHSGGWGTFFCIAPEIRRSMWANPFNNEASSIQIFPNGTIPPCSGSL